MTGAPRTRRRQHPPGVWLLSVLLVLGSASCAYAVVDGLLDGRVDGVAVGGLYLLLTPLLLIWWPRRAAVLDPAATVTVRAGGWLRYASGIALLGGVGLLAGLVGLAPGNDTSPMSPAGAALTTTATGLGGLLLLLVGVIPWTMRQSVGPEEATVRVLLRTHRIRLRTATRLRVGTSRLRTGRIADAPFPRVYVDGPDQHGVPVTAAFDPHQTGFAETLAVLEGWVERRPELADTEVLRFFAAWRAALRTPSA